MRGFSWQRGLTRGINEFLELQLPGLASAPIWGFDPDKTREFVTARFTVDDVTWKIKVETPAEHGPLGWISVIDGPEKFGGPIDSVTWAALGKIIRPHSAAAA
jgi:hypothetical protein